MPDKAPKARILVAEDDASVRQLIRMRLEPAGYQVQVVRDGHEALEQIRCFRPDAMILDINMPRRDGFAVLEALKTMPDVPKIPILMLTARHEQSDVLRAVKLGAKDYLSKPFSEFQLLGRVAKLLSKPFRAADDAC